MRYPQLEWRDQKPSGVDETSQVAWAAALLCHLVRGGRAALCTHVCRVCNASDARCMRDECEMNAR